MRIELRISTTARTTSLRVLDDVMVLAAVAQASGPGRAVIEPTGVAIINNTDGTPATAIFRLVVTSNVASLRLTAGVSPGRTASFEVWNVNDEARPARVSEFTAGAGLELDTNMALLRTGGPLDDAGTVIASCSRTSIRGGIARAWADAAAARSAAAALLHRQRRRRRPRPAGHRRTPASTP